MLNFYLDKERSKTFIEYYEKDDNHLVIHYGNKETRTVPYSNDMEERLNSKMEEQVNNFSDSYYQRKLNEDKIGFSMLKCVGYFMFFSTPTEAIFLKILSLGFSIVCAWKSFIRKRIMQDFKKNHLYLSNKNDIQDYLDEDENKDKTINIVDKEEILSINDVHNMSYSEIRNITNDIARIKEEMVKDRERDIDLGLQPRDVSFKAKVKELKRR